jgi:parallel beta-helix repeat protein
MVTKRGLGLTPNRGVYAGGGDGTDLEALLTTEGDLVVKGATVLERLGVGGEGTGLVISSGVPAWAIVKGVVGATIVVAAVDSVDITRADYVCDGTADQVQINAALTDAGVGGRVVLLEGTYTIAAAIAFTDDNQVLEGQGRGSHIILVNTGNVNGIEVAAAIQGAKIVNLQLDGNKANQSTTSHGIDIASGATPTIVQGCYIHDWLDIGIRVSAKSLIEYNEVTANGNGGLDAGIHLRSAANESIVRFNHVHDEPDYGIYVNNVSRCQIYGNEVASCVSSNIMVGPSSGADTLIAYNYSVSSSNHGIEIDIAIRCLIIGNVTRLNAAAGIHVEDNSSYTIVIGNRSYQDQYGIWLYASSYCNIQGNLIQEPDLHGIYLDRNCDYDHVEGNYVINASVQTNNTYDSIRVRGLNVGNLCTGNRILNNTLVHVADLGSNQHKYGINIDDLFVASSVIKGNKIVGALTAPLNFANQGEVEWAEVYVEHFLDLVALDANGVVAAEDLTAGTPITCTIAGQPDVPRILTLVITDGDVGISAFNIDVVGIDAWGRTITENFVFAGGLSQVSSRPFAIITSVTVNSISGAGAGDVLDVGWNDRLGLGNRIYATADVYKVNKNGGNISVPTVSVSEVTVDLDSITPGDDVTLWYRHNMNDV